VLQWFHIVFASIQQQNALYFYRAGRVGSRVRHKWVGLNAGRKKWPVPISARDRDRQTDGLGATLNFSEPPIPRYKCTLQHIGLSAVGR